MTAVVLLILAVIWAAVLVPPWLQSRRQSRPGDSIASFRAQLNVLERTTPGFRAREATVTQLPRSPRPASSGAAGRAGSDRVALRRAEVRRRRRDVFVTLLGAVVLTFFLALAIGGPVWGLHLVVDVLFAGYVGMLVKLQQQATERDSKLRYLPGTGAARRPEPALLLRRSAN